MIGKWQWTVIHDKNNNGDFLDDEEVQFENKDKLFTYLAEEVGLYQVDLTVTETYVDTIPKFLFDDDFLSSAGEPKVFEVKNHAPSVNGHAGKAMQLDLVATFGDVSDARLEDYSNAFKQVKKNLEDKGVLVRLSGVRSVYTRDGYF